MANAELLIIPTRQPGDAENNITLETVEGEVEGERRLAVAIAGAAEPVQLTGDVVVDTFGALDDAAVSDPDAASATIPSLLRGILAELQAQTTLMTAANAKLDDIVTNTTA